MPGKGDLAADSNTVTHPIAFQNNAPPERALITLLTRRRLRRTRNAEQQPRARGEFLSSHQPRYWIVIMILAGGGTMREEHRHQRQRRIIVETPPGQRPPRTLRRRSHPPAPPRLPPRLGDRPPSQPGEACLPYGTESSRARQDDLTGGPADHSIRAPPASPPPHYDDYRKSKSRGVRPGYGRGGMLF